MKLFKPFLLILLFTTNTVISQNKTDKVTLTITPTTLIDPQPHLRVGTDFCINNFIVASCDFGYGNPTFVANDINDGWNRTYHFYEVRPEMKFYLFRKLYLGTEFFTYKVTSEITDSYYTPKNSTTTINFTQADYEKRKSGFNLKLGIRMMAASRFNIEFYAGLGLACKQVSYHNVQNPTTEDKYDGVVEPSLDRFNTDAGKYWQGNLTTGVKLGYVIVKQKK